jgi:hypothetical protein
MLVFSFIFTAGVHRRMSSGGRVDEQVEPAAHSSKAPRSTIQTPQHYSKANMMNE